MTPEQEEALQYTLGTTMDTDPEPVRKMKAARKNRRERGDRRFYQRWLFYGFVVLIAGFLAFAFCVLVLYQLNAFLGGTGVLEYLAQHDVDSQLAEQFNAPMLEQGLFIYRYRVLLFGLIALVSLLGFLVCWYLDTRQQDKDEAARRARILDETEDEEQAPEFTEEEEEVLMEGTRQIHG